MTPIKIKIVEKKILKVVWDDGSEDLLELRQLRKFCPCATCLSERVKQSNKYIPLFAENQITVKTINQVGKYAIQINWKDRHNTGIYEYVFLKSFSEKTTISI